MGAFFPVDPEKMAEHHDRVEQAREIAAHEIHALFTDLDKEHLRALNMLLEHITRNGDNASASAAYYNGLATAFIQSRFKECAICEKDHDKAFHELAAGVSTEADPNQLALEFPNHTDLNVGQGGELSAAQKETMKAYKLDDLRNEEGILIGFICLNCKTVFQSLEDRMVDAPGQEGCHGCLQKTKWG